MKERQRGFRARKEDSGKRRNYIFTVITYKSGIRNSEHQ